MKKDIGMEAYRLKNNYVKASYCFLNKPGGGGEGISLEENSS